MEQVNYTEFDAAYALAEDLVSPGPRLVEILENNPLVLESLIYIVVPLYSFPAIIELVHRKMSEGGMSTASQAETLAIVLFSIAYMAAMTRATYVLLNRSDEEV